MKLMKVRIDFVSNSSSTSFVYVAQGMLTQDDFFAAVGVNASSPVAGLFQEMFEHLKSSIERGDRLTSTHDIDALEDSREFTPEVLARMREALAQGKIVTTGRLSSDEGLAECILCTEIFEIDSERFFINAYDNYW
jgi:hypothetical protein